MQTSSHFTIGEIAVLFNQPSWRIRRAVAALLGCSTRHVERLEADRLIPPPFRVGRPIRWDRETIDRWIDGGCPAQEVVS